MNKNNLPVLFITGCINPCKEQPCLKIVDPKERYKQYISSIKYYIENTLFNKIVFCDSSNIAYPNHSNLYEIAEVNGKKFEWLCFSGSVEEVKFRGKGYGEGEILKYMLSHSSILEGEERFVKVTGRLKVKNIDKIFKKVKPNRQYFNADLYRSKGLDTRMYCCDVSFYKQHLINLYLECSDSGLEMTLEDLFYDYIYSQRIKISCFPYYPLFSGIGGGNGREYDKENRIKIKVSSILCQVGIFNEFCHFISPIFRTWKANCGYEGYRAR